MSCNLMSQIQRTRSVWAVSAAHARHRARHTAIEVAPPGSSAGSADRSDQAGASTSKPAQPLRWPPAGRAGAAGFVDDKHPWHERIEVIEDRVVYRRYMTLYDRVVTFDQDAKGSSRGAGDAAVNGQPAKRSHTLVYDVVGHPQCEFIFSVAFPFHKATATTPPQVTVIREYAQGPNCLQYCLPTGGFDPRKHGNLLDCARAEMREEAMLVGGEELPLLPDDHPGQSEVKWSRNSFKPYLFIDPQPDPSGHAARDAEEHTIEVSRVTIPELRSLMLGGHMMLPSIFTCYLALEALEARRLI